MTAAVKDDFFEVVTPRKVDIFWRSTEVQRIISLMHSQLTEIPWNIETSEKDKNDKKLQLFSRSLGGQLHEGTSYDDLVGHILKSLNRKGVVAFKRSFALNGVQLFKIEPVDAYRVQSVNKNFSAINYGDVRASHWQPILREELALVELNRTPPIYVAYLSLNAWFLGNLEFLQPYALTGNLIQVDEIAKHYCATPEEFEKMRAIWLTQSETHWLNTKVSGGAIELQYGAVVRQVVLEAMRRSFLPPMAWASEKIGDFEDPCELLKRVLREWIALLQRVFQVEIVQHFAPKCAWSFVLDLRSFT